MKNENFFFLKKILFFFLFFWVSSFFMVFFLFYSQEFFHFLQKFHHNANDKMCDASIDDYYYVVFFFLGFKVFNTEGERESFRNLNIWKLFWKIMFCKIDRFIQFIFCFFFHRINIRNFENRKWKVFFVLTGYVSMVTYVFKKSVWRRLDFWLRVKVFFSETYLSFDQSINRNTHTRLA